MVWQIGITGVEEVEG